MPRILPNIVWILENLFAGVRLALPVRVSRRSFHFSADQAAILLLLSAGAMLFATYPFGAGETYLASYTWVLLPARCFLVLALYYLVSRLQQAPHTLPALAVMLFSVACAFAAAWGLLRWLLGRYGLAGILAASTGADATIGIMTLWSFVAIVRAMRLLYGAGRIRVGILSIAILAGSFGVNYAAPPYFWDVAPPQDAEADSLSPINVERTYYAQEALLARKLTGLARSRRGIGELYFVGFAGTSTQDLFMKEVESAQALFDARFGTRGRSLILVNNPRTVAALPAASASNLHRALDAIARKMDRDNDVLFLYLTSHGSPHLLSVNFPELAFNDLSDLSLKTMLDDAGIKWRVIVVSACYSGSMIDTLKDDHSLIITAAAANRTSFGCSNENNWTYFGDAYINTALRLDRSFVTAFERARSIIAARENSEHLTPSEPQISVGAAIEAKLGALQRRLTELQTTAAEH